MVETTSTYYCSGCWARDHGMQDPALHRHAVGCYERHRVFGERLAPALVARGEHRECKWPDCADLDNRPAAPVAGAVSGQGGET